VGTVPGLRRHRGSTTPALLAERWPTLGKNFPERSREQIAMAALRLDLQRHRMTT
jgi:hypothetical protein